MNENKNRKNSGTVIVESCNTPEEAYVIAGMLRANGVAAMVENLNNLYVPVFNGCNVVVNAVDYEKARRLLEDHDDLPRS